MPIYDFGYPYYDDNSYDDRYPYYDDYAQYRLAEAVQTALAQRGYYRGSVVGVIGPESRRAIEAFQRDQGLPVTGRINASLA